jgi:hypothetical protein
VVLSGGELTLQALDLQFDHGTRFYSAPPHLKANNGIYIVDDLGRQLVQPRELMNRWIVPLDRRVDVLTLHTGERFTVPFEATVVFSTNLPPAALADDAFLRRLGYKIHIGPLSHAQYREVCRQYCEAAHIGRADAVADWLIARLEAAGRPLLACTPRDLLGQLQDRARYLGEPPEPSEALIDWAVANHFVASAEAP